MKTKHIYAIICGAGMLIGGIIGYKVAPKPDFDRAERLERRTFYDSAKIAAKEFQIEELFDYIDSLESDYIPTAKERVKWLIKWDTIYLRQLAANVQDSAVKQALEDCIEGHRINAISINKLTAINIGQKDLIVSLTEQINNYSSQQETTNGLLIELRANNQYLTDKNKSLKMQRNLSWVAIVAAGITIYLLK